MYTLILVLSMSVREGVSTEQITGYISLDKCKEAAATIVGESHNRGWLCVKQPGSVTSPANH